VGQPGREGPKNFALFSRRRQEFLTPVLLGYHVPATPLPGAVTGILAAVAAANLGLIVLEVVRIGERPLTVPSTAIAAVEH
jgi:hypothetical protein